MPNVQCFWTNFFRGVLGRAQRHLDWLCCVALCCVLLSTSYCVVLCCVVLCCDVMCCDLSLTCYSGLLAKNFSVPVPSLHDSMQQLDGRTMVRPARPTGRLNKQNLYCVFSAGKQRFLRGIFVTHDYFSYVP